MLKLCVFPPVHFNSRAIMRALLNVWYWMSQCSVCGRQGKAFLITAASCDVLPLQIVECVTKSLCIEETPLPMNLSRIYRVNCSAKVPNASNFRRGWVCVCVCVCVCVLSVFVFIIHRVAAITNNATKYAKECEVQWQLSGRCHPISFHLIPFRVTKLARVPFRLKLFL